MTINNTRTRNPLHLVTEALDVKNKTAVLRVCDSETKRKEIRAGSMLWSSIPKRIGHKQINEQVNKYLYTCILQHTQVVQSQISNDCLKVSIGNQSEPQLVPKLLPLVSVRDLHNIIAINP